MTAILESITDAVGLVPTVFGIITGNPLLLFLVGVSLVPVGFAIFRKAKGAAK
jgi:hypothetical protein